MGLSDLVGNSMFLTGTTRPPFLCCMTLLLIVGAGVILLKFPYVMSRLTSTATHGTTIESKKSHNVERHRYLSTHLYVPPRLPIFVGTLSWTSNNVTRICV